MTTPPAVEAAKPDEAVKPEAPKTEAPKTEPDPNDTKLAPFKADEIKLPEGFTLDTERTTAFAELVNKHGIPRNVALELAQAQIAHETAAATKQEAMWQETQDNWVKEVKADPVIGGEKLDAALGSIQKLFNRYGDKPTEVGGSVGMKLKEAFNLTGAGNHPAVIKFLYNIAQELGEGGPVLGRPASEPVDVAKRLFPNQN